MSGRQPGRPLVFMARTNQVLQKRADSDANDDSDGDIDTADGSATRHPAGSHPAATAARIDWEAAGNGTEVFLGNNADLISHV